MHNLINEWLLPFSFPFMQYAFLVLVMVSAMTALLSCFLVLKGWSLMGDAISHSVLPGVVIAYVLSIPYVIGAFVAGITCAIATGFLKEHSKIKEDTIMGVVFSGMFGLGLLLMTKVESGVHLDHILYGNVLGVTVVELIETACIAMAVLCFILFKGKDLLIYIFDAQHAQAIGLPVGLLHYGLLSLLSLAIVGALKAVGMILVIAMLIAPGAIAYLLTQRFSTMLVYAMGISVGSALSGLYISFFIDSAPAPTIVLILALCFLVVFTFTSIRQRRLGIT
jgi:manganese/iron transport system permease protein